MKKEKNGFTLIELLAVIIILGILLVIAIPAVTNYINNSRKEAYVKTAKQVVSATKNLVNSGKLDMYDTDVTYYIPNSCIKVENGDIARSPYGNFINDKTYVLVTYNEQGYKYYWISLDESKIGVKEPKSIDKLVVENIETNINPNVIKTKFTMDHTSKTLVLNNSNCSEFFDGMPTAVDLIKTTPEMQLQPIGDNNHIVKGGNPANYVRFNGELWRIIGIYGNQLKIQRTFSLESRRYNNSIWDSNSWETSTMLTYLNGEYFDSLSDDAKEMIDDGTWYVGGVSVGDAAPQVYEKAKLLTWVGKVGLMNPYEYLYASIGENCYDTVASKYETLCGTNDNNWMKQNTYTWTMTPADWAKWRYVVTMRSNGSLDDIFTTNSYASYPVVYLKPSVTITDGTGTNNDPFILSF